MDKIWIVAPVKDNSVDISEFISNLTGGFVAPEKYEKTKNFNNIGDSEVELFDHPHANEIGPDFSGRIILINTEPGYKTFDAAIHLEDFEEHNIARWMNTGIDYAIDSGAEKVVVLSNPGSFDPFVIEDTLKNDSETMLFNFSDGAMFAVSKNLEERLDEQFKIWFWADDFYRRLATQTAYSRTDYFTLEELIPYRVDNKDLEAIVKLDQEKYEAKWS
jgi:hypothetical protein